MRHRVCGSALGLAVVGLVAQREAHALPTEPLRVHVPFSFHVRDVRLPAGHYFVEQARSGNRELLVLRSTDGRRTVFFFVKNASPRTRANRAKLVFDRHGEEQFLRGIVVPSEGSAKVKISPAAVDSPH